MFEKTLFASSVGLLCAALCACSDTSPGSGPRDPEAPSNLVVGPMGGGAHLTWVDNSSDEELFEIERRAPGGGFIVISTVPFDSALYHDADVSLGSAYTYRIRAKLPAGFSAYSNEASVTVVVDQPGMVGSGGNTSGGAGNVLPGAGQPNAGGTGNVNPQGGSGNGAGSPTAGGSAPTAGAGNGEVSFKNDVAPALVKACGSTTTGCHSSDQAVGRIMPQFGPCKVIWFSSVDAALGATYTSGPNMGQPTGCSDLTLYERLMGLHSMLCSAGSWEQRARYVVPGDLDKSLIFQVIAGDPSMGGACKNMDVDVRKMPLVDPKILPNGVELGDDGVAKIKAWILGGAKNN